LRSSYWELLVCGYLQGLHMDQPSAGISGWRSHSTWPGSYDLIPASFKWVNGWWVLNWSADDWLASSL
jgi:hypothetical protein